MEEKSSRLVVKNIGGHVTEKRLREHFAQKGEVTDAKIMFKGLSNRHFGFVGFRSEKEAAEALAYFHNTFLDTNRISVEFAKPQSDPELRARKEKVEKKKKELKRVRKKGAKKEEKEKQTGKENARKKEQFLEDILGKKRAKEEKEEDAKIEEAEIDPRRIFIENLAYSVSEENIRSYFGKYGEIEEVKLPKRKDGSLKGNCLLRFEKEESAITAIGETHLQIFMGRKIYVKPGKKGPKVQQREGMEGERGERGEREGWIGIKKRRFKEGGPEGWSTLYLNPDTVAEVVAEELNVRKGDLLRQEGLAVKMAECEAQLLERTKEWIREEIGVEPERLEGSKKSDRSLLVKSIMKEETQQSLRELFRRYGRVERVQVAPMNTLAFVQYESVQSAEIAVKKLQGFTRKRGPKETPLYLEYAPSALEGNERDQAQLKESKEEEEESSKGKTLFVKNLNFTTTDDTLLKACQEALLKKKGKVVSAKVVKKRESQESAGFGFVETDSEETARLLLRTLEGKIVEEHALQVSMATQSGSKGRKEVKKQRAKEEEKIAPSKKLIIKNVAFEASKKELQEVLGRTGGLRKVRMPKKVGGTGGHRGFGFAEFGSKEEAEKAMRETGGTHLYGKRLVVGWAKEEETG